MTHPRCTTKYSIDGLTSFFHYDGVVRQAIKSIKYRFISDLAEEFVSCISDSSICEITKPQINQTSIFIPIPLHPSRLRFRGFNQAEVLGRLIAEKMNVLIRTDLLKRVRKTTPQVEMKDRKKRLVNMEHVFMVINRTSEQPASSAGGPYSHLSIFLFDDVFTTGATMRTAANVLKRAGADRVWGITMAR